FHLPYDSIDKDIASFHLRTRDAAVKGYAVGPIGMKDSKKQVDDAFDYAKRVGVDLIIGVPAKEFLPYISEKTKEFNIRFAIHNHGPEDKLYPNATVIYESIKDLDSRMGLCFDMGHNMRDGHDPIRDLKRYHKRIFDIHLKNVTSAMAA